MKGKISLVDFIKEVKSELRAAVDNDDPFFEIGEVELEVTFALDVSGKAGIKLIVAELGGETKATQTHKVKLKLHPFVEEDLPSQQVISSGEGTEKTLPYGRQNSGSKTVGASVKAALKHSPKASNLRKSPTASGHKERTPTSRPKAG